MIKEFFLNDKGGIGFELFDISHIFILSVFSILVFIIYIKQDELKNLSDKTKKKIQLLMITILMLNRMLYIGSYIYYGIYTWRLNLPLELCFITGYIFIFSLILKKEWLFKLSYFMTFIGPLAAILLPKFEKSWDYYVFYEFMLSHHFLFLSVLIIFYMHNIKITIKDTLKSFALTLGIFLTMNVFNSVFNTNYIFSKELPWHVLKKFPILNYIEKRVNSHSYSIQLLLHLLYHHGYI